MQQLRLLAKPFYQVSILYSTKYIVRHLYLIPYIKIQDILSR